MAKKAKKKEKDLKQEKFEFVDDKENIDETEEVETDNVEEEVEVEETDSGETEEDTENEESDDEEASEDAEEDSEDDEDISDDEENADDDNDIDEEDSEEDEEDIDDDDEEEDSVETDPVINTLSDKTRYIVIGVGTLLLLGLVICLVIFGKSGESNTTSSSNSNISDDSNISSGISVEERNTSTDFLKEFYKEMDSEELNVILFASATCSFCTLEKPIIEKISKDYDMDYFEIDASSLTNTELNEVIKALGIKGSTPTTVIVKDGKVVTYNQGYLDGIPYVKFFVDNKILPKDATYKSEDGLTSITYKEFKEKIKKDKETLILIDQSACPECTTVRAMLSKLAKENKFKVYYLSAASMEREDIITLVDEDLEKLGYDDKNYVDDGKVTVPLLLVVKNEKIKSYVAESVSESDYTKVLKKYDFIK